MNFFILHYNGYLYYVTKNKYTLIANVTFIYFIFSMYYVDIIAKIVFFGLLLWTIFNWSDSIIAIGLLLSSLLQLFFSSMLSFFNSDPAAESITNKEL